MPDNIDSPPVESAYTCDHCGERIADGRALQAIVVRLSPRRTEEWCQSCADDCAGCCADCDVEISDRLLQSGTNTHGESVCDRCASNYFTCNDCGNRFHEDDLGSDGFCRHCRQPDDDDGEDHSSLIQSYGRTRAVKFFGVGPVYFGVELEVEAKDLHSAAESTLDRLGKDFVSLKEDGSLSHGFEIVTQPASLAEQKVKWAKFFADKPRGLTSYDTKTCGLHVHVSRKPLSQLTIGKILVFVNSITNRGFMESIAGRSTGQWAAYKNKKLTSGMKYPESRYEAVNLQNDKTIEFRIFKGTLNEASFYKAIEFCAAIVAFCGSAERSIQDSASLPEFLKFADKNKKSYPRLADFLKRAWIGVKGSEKTDLGFESPIITRQSPDISETNQP